KPFSLCVIMPRTPTTSTLFPYTTLFRSQLEMQKELNDLYQKHNFNPVKMVTGCLPMILQMPILIGFYYAIRRTPEIAEQSFLWFSLGETDILFVIVAVIIYYLQAKVE